MSANTEKEASLEGLASALLEKGALTSDWIPAFNATPRHLFVPDVIWPGRAGMNRQDDRVIRSEAPKAWWKAVYTDAPITTQWDDGTYDGAGRGKIASSSSSMPTMVFSMLAALNVEDGQRVLEIGTGTGWNSALLCHRLGSENVFTIEVDGDTARAARRRLNDAGHDPVSIIGDGAEGYSAGAPYDRLIATASIGRVPRPWINQVKPGGIIVAPWGPTYGGEAVARLTVAGDGSASGRFIGSSAFMRLREQRKALPSGSAYDTDTDGTRTTTHLSPDDVGEWLHMFVIGVQDPTLFCRVEKGEGRSYRLWLYDTGVTSWAVANYDPGHTEFEVTEHGPRALWDELRSAVNWWDGKGRPGFDRFGLTVDGNGEHVWLDTPDTPVPRLGA
ncbi:protein-L-isoaspartate(D-aspartate) O-methyltransferase [Streptomyces sp. 4F14]|uniref:protein-L-isoaspartate(D-aspartate) O-methyltransferase n=1 Tax=Streptomyces sp. 4F14 TaxID=3394380 RepID=UPI003A8920F7